MVHQKLIRDIKGAESLTDALHWLDFVPHKGDTYVLQRNSNVLAVAEVLSCESQLAADEELNAIRSDFHALVQNLGPGYAFSVHFVRRRSEPLLLETDPSAPEIIRYLRERQTGFWEGRSSAMYENRVFISLEAETGGLKDTLWGALINGKRAFNWARFEASLGRIGNVWHGILDNMAGFARVSPLGQDEMLRLFYYFLNPLQRIAARQISYNPGYTIPEQILDANWANGGDDLCREDNGTAGPHTHFRVLNLETLPAISYPTLFDPLTRLGSSRQDERLSEYWITQHYEALDPEQFITALNIQQNWGNSLANVKALKSIAQKSIDLASDAAEVTNAIQRDKEGAGYFSMFCVVYDRDRARLEGTANRILTEARAKNAKFLVESRFARFASFLSSLPGHSGLNIRQLLNYRQAKVLNANFADLAMLHKDDEGDPEGPVVFETPEGGFFRYHPFSKRTTSWNVYVAGTTGAGKSFLMNHLLANSLSFKPVVYILDVGNSYDPLVQIVPGSVKVSVDFSNPDLKLNPFAFLQPPQQAERVTLTHLIEHLITGGQSQLTQGDRVDLMDALAKTLGEYEPEDPPTLEDYYRALDGLRPELAKPLRLWITGGPYAAFFCHKQDTFQNADLVYFELTGFDDHPDVGSAITYMLFTKIFQRLQRQDEDRKKIIVLDECWKFLMNDTMASKIKELYRTIRKHNGSIQTITQHPNDLINSPHRDAILANTSFLFMLEQKGVGTEARDAFGLNPREHYVMQQVRMKKGQYSELFFKGPYKRQVRVLADPYSYVLYTTDPDEKVQRAKLTAKYGSLQKAVDAMAERGSDEATERMVRR
ncbi:MAG: ATP-binding protein [Chloroflexi bacterium]|nr:ATP-binding protein [Chloroflexota bacterium]